MSTTTRRKVYTPHLNDKLEMRGRMYESLDILQAIDCGEITSIDDVLKRLNQSSSLLCKVLKLDTWVSTEDRIMLDMVETVKHAEQTNKTEPK